MFLVHELMMGQEYVARAQRENALAQEERLAHELERIKLDAMRQDKLRQHVRETSHEIRGPRGVFVILLRES